MGVNIHVAFLIDTLDFETQSSGQMMNGGNITVGETKAQQVCFQNCLSGFGLSVSLSKGRCLHSTVARRTEAPRSVSSATQTSRYPAVCGDTAQV